MFGSGFRTLWARLLGSQSANTFNEIQVVKGPDNQNITEARCCLSPVALVSISMIDNTKAYTPVWFFSDGENPIFSMADE